jgi:hypothetical protein
MLFIARRQMEHFPQPIPKVARNLVMKTGAPDRLATYQNSPEASWRYPDGPLAVSEIGYALS